MEFWPAALDYDGMSVWAPHVQIAAIPSSPKGQAKDGRRKPVAVTGALPAARSASPARILEPAFRSAPMR
jgi:hypothetical protein